MRRILLLGTIVWGLLPLPGWSQEGKGPLKPSDLSASGPAPLSVSNPKPFPGTSPFSLEVNLDPLEFGARYDDNVYRSPYPNGKFADEVYLLGAGLLLNAKYDIFNGDLEYRLGAEQYQLYTEISNLENNFSLLLAAAPAPLSLYYKKNYFVRNSHYEVFNYIDDDNLGGLLWSPSGPWSYGAQAEYFTRTYYSSDPVYMSQNYMDQGFKVNTQREIDDKFSLALEGSYNNRQFNRYAVASGGTGILSAIQTDETWTLLLKAHLYFESILQDITLEQQRTNSNSYGFSNSVQSVSWAAVVRPASSLYLQLFFRLYSKTYDTPPLNLPDLQVGFIDEDGQDLLSIRTTWEWAPQWTASLGISRVRNESTQPGLYYIKDIISAQVRRSF